jgi:hypothetical protein
MSAGFDPHTLGLGGESVAQGCENLPPVAGLKESLSWAWAIADNSWSLAWRAVPSSQEGTCVSALQPGGHLHFCEIGGHLEGTFVKLEDIWRARCQTLICKLKEKVDDWEKNYFLTIFLLKKLPRPPS